MVFMESPNQFARWVPTDLVHLLLSTGARQVVRAWLESPEFLDEQRDPALMALEGEGAGSFAGLVRGVNPDYVPLVILNELLRKGMVETVGNDGLILLRRSAYAPRRPTGKTLGATQSTVFSSDPGMMRRYSDRRR